MAIHEIVGGGGSTAKTWKYVDGRLSLLASVGIYLLYEITISGVVFSQ